MDPQQALEAYIRATNTHDFQQVKAILHENALYWFSDKTCATPGEIREYFENAWRQVKDEVYRAEDVHWIVTDENSAACLYTYRYEGYVGERLVSGSGRATNVFVKTKTGAWKLLHEHLSGHPK